MFRATHTPPLSVLLDDLLTRDSRAIARHLDCSVKTLERWKQADQAPRTAMLALFYETRWGHSLIHSTAHNEAVLYRQQVGGLQRENAMLRARVARLERLGSYGAANEPTVAPVIPRGLPGFAPRPTAA